MDEGKSGMLLGAHMSISGGLESSIERSEELGINAMQIFSHNVRSWDEKVISADQAKTFRKRMGASPVLYSVIHTSYLLNLASPKDELWQKSKEGLLREIRRASKLGVHGINTHIGAHTGSGREAGIERLVSALNEIAAREQFNRSQVTILLETTSGSGTSLGARFRELGTVLKGLKRPGRFGVCLDTCHAYAAGYDVATKKGLHQALSEMDREVGLENLELVHLNDSKGKLGSAVDRHEHIGQGEIGVAGFRRIVNHPHLRELPFILETPKEKVDGRDGDIVNLNRIRNIRECSPQS